jgi:hypothetical protein
MLRKTIHSHRFPSIQQASPRRGLRQPAAAVIKASLLASHNKNDEERRIPHGVSENTEKSTIFAPTRLVARSPIIGQTECRNTHHSQLRKAPSRMDYSSPKDGAEIAMSI